MGEDEPRWKVIGFWVLCVLLAVAFLASGGTKLVGQQMHIENFARWGYPDWFRLVVGSWEVISGLLLLYPATRFYGAAVLTGTMVGALATHMVHAEPEAYLPVAVLLILNALVAWSHRRQFTTRWLGS